MPDDPDPLSPCPFCPKGGKPLRVFSRSRVGNECYSTACDECNIYTPWFPTREESDAYWNGRYIPPRKCPICKLHAPTFDMLGWCKECASMVNSTKIT